MKKSLKVLLSILMTLVITIFSISPALASSNTVTGTDDGYSCSGYCGCFYDIDGAKASTTFAYGGKLNAYVFLRCLAQNGWDHNDINNSSVDYSTYVTCSVKRAPAVYSLSYAYGKSTVQVFPSGDIWSKKTANVSPT